LQAQAGVDSTGTAEAGSWVTPRIDNAPRAKSVLTQPPNLGLEFGHVMELLAVDLCSGHGDHTLGLKRAGFRAIGAIEIDPLALEIY